MRRSLALAIALVAASAAPSHAQLPIGNGTVSFSWDVCSPLVVDKVGTAGPHTVYASVIGHDETTLAHQVWLGVTTRFELHVEIGPLPDAWRFDTTDGSPGCNAGRTNFSVDTPPELAESCPSLVPAGVPRTVIQAVQMAPPPLGYPTHVLNPLIAVRIENGGVGVTPDPTKRYMLASFTFDHSLSTSGLTAPDRSTCGGLDCPIYIWAMPSRVSYLNASGVEKRFQLLGGSGNLITFNGSNWLCEAAVPAHLSTWGAIKAQYH